MTRLIAVEGTSISAGGGYITPYANSTAIPTDVLTFAVSGSVVADIVGRAASVDAAFVAGELNILVVEPWANEFQGGNSTTDAQHLLDLRNYLVARAAAGWTIVITTPLPQDSTRTNFMAYRPGLITTVRSWIGTYASACIDWAADPTIGTIAAGNNTTYYGDGIHPTTTGRGIMSNVAAPVLDTFISQTRRRLILR
jgi:hypothetical protein